MPTSPDTYPLDALLEAVAAAENGPRPRDLEHAPHLDFWRLRWMPGLDLLVAEGAVTGHPVITEPWVTTSPVLGFDPDAGWMRTRSRWYRLGDPADPGHIEVIREAAQRYFAALRARILKNKIQTN